MIFGVEQFIATGFGFYSLSKSVCIFVTHANTLKIFIVLFYYYFHISYSDFMN